MTTTKITNSNNDSIEVKRKKLLPIIDHFLKSLSVEDLLDKYFPLDKRENIKKSKVIISIIANIIIANKPLYELRDWLLSVDYECLGLSLEDVKYINDDKASRTLEAFYAGEHKGFFFDLALKAIEVFRLDCSQLHNDGTTVNVYGGYETGTAAEKITYGKSKHVNANLKQLLLGITATSDGFIPLAHYVRSGNYSESKIHINHFNKLRELLGENEFIYVADSKLSSAKNLSTIAAAGGRYISLLPRSCKATYDDLHFDLQQLEWKKCSELVNYKYCTKAYQPKWDQDAWIYWIYSENKQRRDALKRKRFISKSIKRLIVIKRNLNKYKYKTESYIENAILKTLTANKVASLISFQILEQDGFFSLKLTINTQEYRRQQEMYGRFPLITNTDKDAEQALTIYKQQSFIEKKFTHLKSYQQIAPVYLKKTKRVVAYLHIQVIGLMISSLIERAIDTQKHNLDIYPEHRNCKKVTIYDLNRLFELVETYSVNNNIKFGPKLDDNHLEVLKLLGIEKSAFA